jgi:serine/threonine-protein kinase
VGGQATIAGRYRLTGQRRRAGWGHVFGATDEPTGRPLLVSVTLPGTLPDGEPALVRREVTAAARLDHAGLLALRRARRLDGGLLHVEDDPGGISLRDAVAAHGPLPDPVVEGLARDLLDAVAAAHASGVVHGAIGPSEVHLPEGVGGPVRLGGFGRNRALAVRRGAPVGDERFLAPEQRAGVLGDEAADVWAVGAVLRHARRPAGDGRSARLDRALETLLRPDPAARPRAAEARELLDGPALVELPAPVAAPPLLTPARWLLLAVCLALVVGGVVVLRGGSPPAPEVAVPDLRGLGEEAAVGRLEEAGLDVRVLVQADPDVDRGAVARQEPAAGTTVQAGDPVTIVVSTGDVDVLIPDVLGRSEVDAEAALQDVGLVARVQPRLTADALEGTVVEQHGNPGNTVERGSEVRLVVARTP